MDLFTKLDKLGRRTNAHIPTIDHGGCCLYAYLVGKELLAMGIPARVFTSRCYLPEIVYNTNIDAVRPKIPVNTTDEWNAHDISFEHLGVEFDYKGTTWHVDSQGVHSGQAEFRGRFVYPGRFTVAEAEELYLNSTWNTDFPRSMIPTVEDLVRQTFHPVLV